MFVPYCKQRLFIGAPLSFSQKIGKLLSGSQNNFPIIKNDWTLPAAMVANFFTMLDQFYTWQSEMNQDIRRDRAHEYRLIDYTLIHGGGFWSTIVTHIRRTLTGDRTLPEPGIQFCPCI
jgi:hypothetical protein